MPLPLVGAVRNPELAPCAACGTECRFLFHINGGDGDAETKLVDSTCSQMLEAVAKTLDGAVAARSQEMLKTTMQSDGICVCFQCAVPVLTQRHIARVKAQRQPSPAAASSSEEASRPARIRKRPQFYTQEDRRIAFVTGLAYQAWEEKHRRTAVTAEPYVRLVSTPTRPRAFSHAYLPAKPVA